MIATYAIMMIVSADILGQGTQGSDWKSLIYLLLLLVLPVLNGIVEWFKKRAESKRQQNEAEEIEVIVEDDEPPVYRPFEPPKPARPIATAPPPPPIKEARPFAAPPVAAPPPRPAPIPVVRPVTPTPRTVQPRPAAPARPVVQPENPYAVTYEADYDVVYEADYDAAYEAQRAKRLAMKQTPAKPKPPAGPPPARKLLAGEPLTRANLRRAVILSEILSPPVALRNESNAPFARPEI